MTTGDRLPIGRVPAEVIHGNALDLPLPDASVDLVVTSRRAKLRGMGRRLKDPLANWWSKVDTGGNCWTWTAGTDADGYGKFAVGHGGKTQTTVRAHRFAYETFVGPIPDGMVVMHACDNPPCCNPDHLTLGTSQDNTADKVAKGRQAPVWGRPLAHSRQTECGHGHPFDEANTYVDRRGYRSCRACRRAAARRAYYAKRG